MWVNSCLIVPSFSVHNCHVYDVQMVREFGHYYGRHGVSWNLLNTVEFSAKGRPRETPEDLQMHCCRQGQGVEPRGIIKHPGQCQGHQGGGGIWRWYRRPELEEGNGFLTVSK